jgi:hypothetical protein
MKASCIALGAAILVATVRPSAADLTLTRGGTWQLDVRAGAIACVLGRCVSDSAEVSDTLSLPAGTIVRMEVQVWSCSIQLGDYGYFVPRKRGRIKFKIAEREALADLVRRCSPYPSFRLRKVSGSERLAADGASFESKVRLGGGFQTSGQTVSVAVTAKVSGTLLSGEPLSAAAVDADAGVPTAVGAEGLGPLVDRLLGAARETPAGR